MPSSSIRTLTAYSLLITDLSTPVPRFLFLAETLPFYPLQASLYSGSPQSPPFIDLHFTLAKHS